MREGRSLRICAIACLLGLALLGPASSGCGQKETEPTPFFRPVLTRRVFSTGGFTTRTFPGIAQAERESRLSFRVPGKIQRLEVKVGDRVRAGQLIAALDPEDYRLQVEETEASLDRARAESRNAEANYARVRALYENRNASRNELDGARAAAESTAAQVLAIQKRLELVRAQLSYTRLEAASEGSIAEVYVEANENVQAGQPVVLLTGGSRPEVLVGVPESLIAQVRPGDRTAVAFDAVPHRKFAATVLKVGVVSGASTTYPVTVRLDDPVPEVRPGMAAEVSFSFSSGPGSGRFLVPAAAVSEDRKGLYVFVAELGPGGLATVRRQPVRVGELREEGLEILEGLRDGDLLIVAGMSRVADGEIVRILEAEGGQP